MAFVLWGFLSFNQLLQATISTFSDFKTYQGMSIYNWLHIIKSKNKPPQNEQGDLVFKIAVSSSTKENCNPRTQVMPPQYEVLNK